MSNMNFKCRFYKVEADPKANNRPVCFMLPNQTYKDRGKSVDFDPSLLVVFTDPIHGQSCKPGEVYGAASIEYSEEGKYYMVKSKSYRVMDEDGVVIMDGEGDENYERAIELWDEYTTVHKSGTTSSASSTHAQPVAKVLTEIEKLKKDPRFKPPTIENDGFYVSDQLWYDLILCARHKVSVLLLGPKGTGKTELIELVASKIGHGYDCFDMSIQNPYSYLCGNTRLTDKGETVFQYARFAQLVQTPDDTIICLDELSRCAPSASNILLPVLDRRRTLFIENAIDEKGRVINVGENVSFWATANMGAEYLGVAGLDEALFDRFVVMETAYPPKTMEMKLLMKRCGIDGQSARLLASFAESVRNHKDIATKISTRKVLEIGRWVSWGFPITQAIEKVALSIWPGDESDGGERLSVKAILQQLN